MNISYSTLYVKHNQSYAKQTSNEFDDLRTKLKFYLNSTGDSDAKKKIIQILASSKQMSSDRKPIMKYRGEDVEENEKEDQNEEIDEEKPVSNVGRTLRIIYENMKQQTVMMKMQQNYQKYVAVDKEIDAIQSAPNGYDPTTLAEDMNKSIQNIKKKTIADVLQLIHNKKPQLIDGFNQVGCNPIIDID